MAKLPWNDWPRRAVIDRVGYSESFFADEQPAAGVYVDVLECGHTKDASMRPIADGRLAVKARPHRRCRQCAREGQA